MQISGTDMEALAATIAKDVEARILASASPGRWLALQEAMRYAKVKFEDTIRRWIKEGGIYLFLPSYSRH